MPRESSDNWGFVCPLHTPQPRPDLAAEPPEVFVDHYVKVAFPVPNSTKSEHMWVHVTAVTEDGLLMGTLNNDPVLATQLHDGMPITLARDGIEAVDPPLRRRVSS